MTDDQRRDHDVRRGSRPRRRSVHLIICARRSGPSSPRHARSAGRRCSCAGPGFGRRRGRPLRVSLWSPWSSSSVGSSGNRTDVANPGQTPTATASSASPVASSSPIPTPSGILLSAGSRTTDDLHTDPAVQCPSGMDPGVRRADGVPHQSPTAGSFRQTDGAVYSTASRRTLDRWRVNPTVGCRPWKAWGRARRSSRRG